MNTLRRIDPDAAIEKRTLYETFSSRESVRIVRVCNSSHADPSDYEYSVDAWADGTPTRRAEEA